MEEDIKKFIIDMFMYGEGSIENDQQLFEAGILDSLGFMKLLAFIENKYGIKASMSEIAIERFGTVNDIAAFIKGKQ